MDAHTSALILCPADYRGRRQHRFMEAADVNAAFREMFGPLRTSIRRGMSVQGQLYALEMDACVPGEVLGAEWIPPLARGVDDPALLADPARRGALFERLLDEPRPEALVAWVQESVSSTGQATLELEIASVDTRYAASYPITEGSGWHRRELLLAPHRRLGRSGRWRKAQYAMRETARSSSAVAVPKPKNSR